MRGSSSWMMTQSSSSSSSIEGAKATGWSQGVATTYHSPSSSSRMKQPGKQSMVRPVFVQRSAIGAASSSARRKSTAGRGVPRGRGTGPVTDARAHRARRARARGMRAHAAAARRLAAGASGCMNDRLYGVSGERTGTAAVFQAARG